MTYSIYYQQLLEELEKIAQLAVAQKRLREAIKALELIAKITGILRSHAKRSDVLHLHELSNEQINVLIAEASGGATGPTASEEKKVTDSGV